MDDSFWEEVERAKLLTLEQKFLGTLELSELSHDLVASGIRHQFPEASDLELHHKALERNQLAREMELLF